MTKDAAYSCGIIGFSVLHGLLLAEIEQETRFMLHFLCRLAPTYYDMMVAAIVSGSRIVLTCSCTLALTVSQDIALIVLEIYQK